VRPATGNFLLLGIGSHLAALGNHHIHIRHVLPSVSRFGVLHLLDDVHTVNDLTEDDVLIVEEGCRDRRDEELRAVGVGARVLEDKSVTPH